MSSTSPTHPGGLRFGALLGLAVLFFTLAVGFRVKEFGDVAYNQQDIFNYARTVVQASDAFKSHHLLTRISEADLGGQGYPLFQFYPPLSFLIPGFLDAYVLHDVPLSINVAIALMYVVSGFALYGTARCLGVRPTAAIVGAVAFLTFPFWTHISTFHTPMFYGLAVSTTAVWGLAAWLTRGGVVPLGVVIAGTFALGMTHILSIALYIPCLAILVFSFGGNGRAVWVRRLLAFVAMGLGLAASAFQIGPAWDYGHQGLLRMGNLLSGPEQMYAFAHRNMTWSALLSPRVADSIHNHPPTFSENGFQLGLAYVFGICVSLFLMVRMRVRIRVTVGLLAVLALSIALMSPSTLRAIPMLGVFQMPMRFLGMAAVPGALLVALALDPLAQRLEAAESPQPLSNAPSLAFWIGSALVIAVIALSSFATQVVVGDSEGNTGLDAPVSWDQVLQDHQSTTSAEYLVDGYHYADKFPDAPLLGHAQYFLYWHRYMAERGMHYRFPEIDLLPKGTSLALQGSIPAGIPLPQTITFKINGEPVGSLTFNTRDFSTTLRTSRAIKQAREISYEADKSVDIEGHAMVAVFMKIVFEGFPREKSVIYWDETDAVIRRKSDTTWVNLTAREAGPIYVFPEFAYPGLQTATVDGEPEPIIDAPRNDVVLCGFRLTPGRHEIRIVFTGDHRYNMLSGLGALAAAVLLGGLLLRREPLLGSPGRV